MRRLAARQAVLPDGRLASASGRNGIILWDPASGAETGRLKSRDEVGVHALAVLPNGRLVSGGDDAIIRLWDLARGSETVRLKGHHGDVRALVMLPDGRLASVGNDRTIRVWDLARGAEIARLEVDGAVTCLAAVRDGRLVAGDFLSRLHWLVIVG